MSLRDIYAPFPSASSPARAQAVLVSGASPTLADSSRKAVMSPATCSRESVNLKTFEPGWYT